MTPHRRRHRRPVIRHQESPQPAPSALPGAAHPCGPRARSLTLLLLAALLAALLAGCTRDRERPPEPAALPTAQPTIQPAAQPDEPALAPLDANAAETLPGLAGVPIEIAYPAAQPAANGAYPIVGAHPAPEPPLGYISINTAASYPRAEVPALPDAAGAASAEAGAEETAAEQTAADSTADSTEDAIPPLVGADLPQDGAPFDWSQTDNYLLLGADLPQRGGSWRTDTIMVVGIDRAGARARPSSASRATSTSPSPATAMAASTRSTTWARSAPKAAAPNSWGASSKRRLASRPSTSSASR